LAVPSTISFQGALKDENGVPVNDTKYLDFRIYDDPIVGSLLWNESHTDVEIVDGIFSEELGSSSSFPSNLFDNPALFITFYIGGEEMTPRQKLHSVPYALKAENADLIEDVTLAGLVQQDVSGNVTITGTMTADDFAGDGSGLTGISGDDLGNHTATGNVQLNGHWLSNDGGNEGVFVTSDGDVSIGLNNPSEKLDVSGKIHTTEGFSVTQADLDGLYVGSAYNDGVYVDVAEGNGIHVRTAGDPTAYYDVSDVNGIEIEGAAQNGLSVGRADANGVYVYSAGDDGINVSSAEGIGLYVNSTGNDGVYIYTAGDDGVFVYEAGTPTTHYIGAGKNGFEVAGAEGNGLYIGHADNDGVYVSQAGYLGVYANTEQVSHEWGMYTNDKIYGSNITTRSQSTYVRYVGNEILETGDLVCIAGGYEEDVLGGEDDLPVVNVTKANSSNSEAVLGVVEYKVNIQVKSEELDDRKTEAPKSFRYSEGSVSSGDYLSVIVFGPTDVKIDAREDIRSGQMLASGDEVARKAQTKEIDGMLIAENVGIIGKALEDSNGKGMIKVFVGCK